MRINAIDRKTVERKPFCVQKLASVVIDRQGAVTLYDIPERDIDVNGNFSAIGTSRSDKERIIE